MAKKEKGFSKSIRNRGEDINTPLMNGQYDYRPQNQYENRSQERAIRRREVRNTYENMYQLEQERDQRSFNRLNDLRNEFYAGVDPRRRKEIAEGGMVREDRTAMANLPQHAVHCEYPQSSYYTTPYVADLVRGTSQEPDDDGRTMNRYLNPQGPRGYG